MATREDRNQAFSGGKLITEEIVQVDITAEVNRRTIEDRLDAADAALAALANGTAAMTVAQATAAIRQVAKIQLGILRLVRNRPDATGT